MEKPVPTLPFCPSDPVFYKNSFFPLKVICNFHNVVWSDRDFFLFGYLSNLIVEKIRGQRKAGGERMIYSMYLKNLSIDLLALWFFEIFHICGHGSPPPSRSSVSALLAKAAQSPKVFPRWSISSLTSLFSPGSLIKLSNAVTLIAFYH